ncbi:hypothetical protein SASPL_101143 [Salvia splendens]|uniref:Reverse transcriptase Ty1/copia-type domain-containing protein n=1 Tax=Salvia splendens TaxID=180675 RepID=A0A8X9ABM9_SALSN|nr:hypothetical protein SASPL_101143 [Salvia splendens]
MKSMLRTMLTWIHSWLEMRMHEKGINMSTPDPHHCQLQTPVHQGITLDDAFVSAVFLINKMPSKIIDAFIFSSHVLSPSLPAETFTPIASSTSSHLPPDSEPHSNDSPQLSQSQSHHSPDSPHNTDSHHSSAASHSASGDHSFTSASNAIPIADHVPGKHHMTTRSKSGIFKPKLYNLSISSHFTPKSAQQALLSSAWRAAMLVEFTALLKNKTRILTTLPPEKNLVGCTWIFKLKLYLSREIARNKARLVAQGFSQQPGFDFTETFSPVVKPATIRLRRDVGRVKLQELHKEHAEDNAHLDSCMARNESAREGNQHEHTRSSPLAAADTSTGVLESSKPINSHSSSLQCPIQLAVEDKDDDNKSESHTSHIPSSKSGRDV